MAALVVNKTHKALHSWTFDYDLNKNDSIRTVSDTDEAYEIWPLEPFAAQ